MICPLSLATAESPPAAEWGHNLLVFLSSYLYYIRIITRVARNLESFFFHSQKTIRTIPVARRERRYKKNPPKRGWSI